jgi:hypothetical protein
MWFWKPQFSRIRWPLADCRWPTPPTNDFFVSKLNEPTLGGSKPSDQSFLAGAPWSLRRYTSLSHRRIMKRYGSLKRVHYRHGRWSGGQKVRASASVGVLKRRKRREASHEPKARGGGGEGGRLEWRRSSRQLRGGSGPLASCWRQERRPKLRRRKAEEVMLEATGREREDSECVAVNASDSRTVLWATSPTFTSFLFTYYIILY